MSETPGRSAAPPAAPLGGDPAIAQYRSPGVIAAAGRTPSAVVSLRSKASTRQLVGPDAASSASPAPVESSPPAHDSGAGALQSALAAAIATGGAVDLPPPPPPPPRSARAARTPATGAAGGALGSPSFDSPPRAGTVPQHQPALLSSGFAASAARRPEPSPARVVLAPRPSPQQPELSSGGAAAAAVIADARQAGSLAPAATPLRPVLQPTPQGSPPAAVEAFAPPPSSSAVRGSSSGSSARNVAAGASAVTPGRLTGVTVVGGSPAQPQPQQQVFQPIHSSPSLHPSGSRSSLPSAAGAAAGRGGRSPEDQAAAAVLSLRSASPPPGVSEGVPRAGSPHSQSLSRQPSFTIGRGRAGSRPALSPRSASPSPGAAPAAGSRSGWSSVDLAAFPPALRAAVAPLDPNREGALRWCGGG